MRISRQIGWSQEANLIYQIIKQTERLNQILPGNQAAYRTGISKQIGWSNEANLYYEWLVSLNKLTAHFGCPDCTTTTTTTGQELSEFSGFVSALDAGCGGRNVPVTIYITPACAAPGGIIIGCQIWSNAAGTIPAPDGDYGNFTPDPIDVGCPAPSFYLASVQGGVVTNVICCIVT